MIVSSSATSTRKRVSSVSSIACLLSVQQKSPQELPAPEGISAFAPALRRARVATQDSHGPGAAASPGVTTITLLRSAGGGR